MRRFHRAAALCICMLGTVICSTAVAADWTMAHGNVHFHTPASWTRIMSSAGDPQVMAFQVPDPSPTGKTTLARVVVTTTRAPDVSTFKAFISKAHERAATQPGVKIDKSHSSDTVLRYSADENGTRQVVEEHFVLTADHAIEISCIRPQHSRAGTRWKTAFDTGCHSILKQVK